MQVKVRHRSARSHFGGVVSMPENPQAKESHKSSRQQTDTARKPTPPRKPMLLKRTDIQSETPQFTAKAAYQHQQPSRATRRTMTGGVITDSTSHSGLAAQGNSKYRSTVPATTLEQGSRRLRGANPQSMKGAEHNNLPVSITVDDLMGSEERSLQTGIVQHGGARRHLAARSIDSQDDLLLKLPAPSEEPFKAGQAASATNGMSSAAAEFAKQAALLELECLEAASAESIAELEQLLRTQNCQVMHYRFIVCGGWEIGWMMHFIWHLVCHRDGN